MHTRLCSENKFAYFQINQYFERLTVNFLSIYENRFGDSRNNRLVWGSQKNRLIETVLFNTHNVCYGLEIGKI